MKVSLDFDDFSVLRNRMDLLLELKEHYPEMKVSMFTIPYDYEMESTQLALQRDKFLKLIKENLDWIQIIPHGLAHLPREFEKADAETTRIALKAIDEVFSKDGLPYVKGFKAPQWLWNKDVVRVLNEEGWWGAVDRNQPGMVKTDKFYTYSHSISEPFWNYAANNLKLHGHISGPSENNIEDCFINLMKIPHNAEWHYVTDFIEEDDFLTHDLSVANEAA